ncbi:MAG: FtsX-like permease family protein [bacterium]|nr:FtsX-like permease family protein [bacterium]
MNFRGGAPDHPSPHGLGLSSPPHAGGGGFLRTNGECSHSAHRGSATPLFTVWAAPELTLDLRLFAFTGLPALAAGLGSGWLPAWQAARRDLVPALKDSGEAPRRGWFGEFLRLDSRELMVAVQVALSSALLICAALMWRSFGNLTNLDPGFDRHGLLTAMVSLESREMTPQERLIYLDDLVGRLAGEPGVMAASVSRGVPFGAESHGRVEVEGREKPFTAELLAVGPTYFATLKHPVLRGRALDERDSAEAAGAVLVNEELVRRHFQGREPIGRRLSLGDGEAGPEGGTKRDFQIVGVVSSIGLGELEKPKPQVYFSLAQRGHSPVGRLLSPGFGLLVRTAAPPAWLYRTLRVHAPDLAVMNIVSMTDLVEARSRDQRCNAWYFSALALLGLALSAAGLWSVLNVAVRRRRREIGIRMSLGARRADVATLVLRRGMWAVAVGLGFGLVLALATTRLLKSMLFGVGTLDAGAFVGGAAVLLLVALVSVALPAYRAARVDPLPCLREE